MLDTINFSPWIKVWVWHQRKALFVTGSQSAAKVLHTVLRLSVYFFLLFFLLICSSVCFLSLLSGARETWMGTEDTEIPRWLSFFFFLLPSVRVCMKNQHVIEPLQCQPLSSFRLTIAQNLERNFDLMGRRVHPGTAKMLHCSHFKLPLWNLDEFSVFAFLCVVKLLDVLLGLLVFYWDEVLGICSGFWWICILHGSAQSSPGRRIDVFCSVYCHFNCCWNSHLT